MRLRNAMPRSNAIEALKDGNRTSWEASNLANSLGWR